MDTDAERRRMYRHYARAFARWGAEWAQQGYPSSAAPAFYATRPIFPEICHGLTCGATTRHGTPCKRLDLHGLSPRCWQHGGLSTGPKRQRASARRHGMDDSRSTGSEPHEHLRKPAWIGQIHGILHWPPPGGPPPESASTPRWRTLLFRGVPEWSAPHGSTFASAPAHGLERCSVPRAYVSV
jgi:hypothetical protein